MKTKTNTTSTKEIIAKDNLTLRDYLAAKAMQGYCSMENKGTFRSIEEAHESLASRSYEIADAMLKQREL